MWHLGQVHDKGFIADGFTKGNRQLHFGLLKFLGSDDRTHGNSSGLFVRNFDAYSTFSGDWSYDPNPQGGQGKGDVVFEVLYFGDPYACFRHNLIKGHRRPDGRFDLCDTNLVVLQGIDDLVFVLLEFFLVYGDTTTAAMGIEQIQMRKLIFGEFQGWVEFPEVRYQFLCCEVRILKLVFHGSYFDL